MLAPSIASRATTATLEFSPSLRKASVYIYFPLGENTFLLEFQSQFYTRYVNMKPEFTNRWP